MKNYTEVILGESNNLLDELEHYLRGYNFSINMIRANKLVLEHIRDKKNKNFYIVIYLKENNNILFKNGYPISDFLHGNLDIIERIIFIKDRFFTE